MATATRVRAVKPDPVGAAAVDLAREAAFEAAGVIGVGEHLGVTAEADRVVHHLFACPHPGYRRLGLVGDAGAGVASQDP